MYCHRPPFGMFCVVRDMNDVTPLARCYRDHETRNSERKLNKDQRREKKIKKMKEDTSNGVIVAVYRYAPRVRLYAYRCP